MPAVLLGELLKGFLRDGEHAACPASAVVNEIGSRLDLVGDGKENEGTAVLWRVFRIPPNLVAAFCVAIKDESCVSELPYNLFVLEPG
ncbi:MAG: hypothetical protein MZV70_45105 [Desulfobacterales bacterium]|nr:hypothetical protein [Desulfobacterales bacterium]